MPVLNTVYLKFGQLVKKISPKLYCKFFEQTAFAKFFVSGGVGGSIDLILLYLFHDLLNLGVVWSTSLAFLLSFMVSFYLQRVWTFNRQEGKKVPRELVLYILNAFLSLNINGFSMHFLVVELNIWYLLSQIIVNIFLGILNFFIYKHIIFRNDDEINCEQE